MEINAVQYNPELENDWDNFIENNKKNATFLNSRKFLKHNAQNAVDDCSLVFYNKNKIIGVLPAAFYVKENTKIFHSHPRSTYGGFVLLATAGMEEAMEIVASTIIFAKSINANEIIIRNPFRIFNLIPADESDYAMWYHGFTIKYRELEIAVKLDEESEKRYENGARYSIKKASRLVVVKEVEDYEAFWNMLTNNLLQKHNTHPTHNLQQFMNLKSLVGSDKIKLFGGFVEDNFVCGVIIFVCNSMALHAQYIASDLNYQEKRPLNAVIDHIIKWGVVNGFQYLNLGTANENCGREINYGLFHFKEGFGGRGILRETMHLNLND